MVCSQQVYQASSASLCDRAGHFAWWSLAEGTAMHRATFSDQASWRDSPLPSQGPASCASLPWGFAGVNLYFYPVKHTWNHLGCNPLAWGWLFDFAFWRLTLHGAKPRQQEAWNTHGSLEFRLLSACNDTAEVRGFGELIPHTMPCSPHQQCPWHSLPLSVFASPVSSASSY